MQHFDTEAIYALIAPRPHLQLSGDQDGGAPTDGIEVLEKKLAAVYRLYGKARALPQRHLQGHRPRVPAGDEGRDGRLVRAAPADSQVISCTRRREIVGRNLLDYFNALIVAATFVWSRLLHGQQWRDRI